MKLRSLAKKIPLLILSLCFANIVEVARAEEPPCAGNDLVVAQKARDSAKAAMDKSIASIDSQTHASVDALSKWFGAKSSTDAQEVRDVLTRSRVFLDGATLLCAVSTSAKLGDVYAYVRPDQSFVIVLGAFFFKAPDSGYNSKPGVFVHELSHFVLAGATEDTIYGVEEAKQLALTSPSSARGNADNYEYFVEATVFGL